jgi:GDP-L-fucose synthase
MNVDRLHALGWHHTTSLEQGIGQTWQQVSERLFGEV